MSTPPLLLRSVYDDTGLREEAFRDGRWQPTNIINEYKAGLNNFVEEIDEDQARALQPAAFLPTDPSEPLAAPSSSSTSADELPNGAQLPA